MKYLIVALGAYRHSIYGPWIELQTAKAMAERLTRSKEWKDGYHSFEILECKPQDNESVFPLQAEPVLELIKKGRLEHELRYRLRGGGVDVSGEPDWFWVEPR